MKKLFISHDKKDKWVRDWLVPHLQGYEAELLGEGLTFKIGISRLQNIEDAIEAADHTLLVVSPNWLASEWTELESLILQTDSPANWKRNFLILRLEDCELPRRLRPFTYLDLTDAATRVAEIGRLMGQLGIPQRDGEPISPIVSPTTPLNPVSATLDSPPSPSPPDPPVELPDLTDFTAVLAFNQANLNRLKEQMGRPGKVIPFVGAGMSVPYGFKSWKDYLMFHAGQFGIAKAVEGLLNDGKYEEAAQVLLEAMSPHAFHAAITDEYGPQKLKDFQPRAVTALILRLTAGPVITTNYDRVLERTFEGAGQAFYRVAEGAQVDGVSQAIESHRNILLKIHGDAEERTNRILTLAEYRQHYGDVDKGGYDPKLPLPKALSRLMGATPLLFLGCSLEVDRTMKVLSAITQALDHGGHYAILPLLKDPSKLVARKRELSQHHVFPIWYDSSNGHGMVEEILRWVLGEGGRAEVESGAEVAEKAEWPPLSAEHVSLGRLPETSGLLFGRDIELALLDQAWENGKNAVCFVAQGGEGKTALVRRWVNEMKRANFRGAERVYAWSFYSQGTSEDRQVSSDLFLAETLTWFGDAEMANIAFSASQKAQRLAALVGQQRTLLILDGLEPLQYPQGEPHHGRIRDEGIKSLLKQLAAYSNGLCLITTRVPIRELSDSIGLGDSIQERLPRLDNEAGIMLLKKLGVPKGRQKDFEDAVEEYHGHALALTLLGNLLKEYCEGDVRKRDVIPSLEEEDEWGGHARRVLAWYEQHFEGKPELNILRILGLFDRPAEVAVVKALRSVEPIPGITDALQGLSDINLKKATKHLHSMGLLEEGDALDCHPLIREYFAQQLSQEQPEAWKAAHQRLYEYYKALPEKELPDTLEEMEPLYRAMGHGCKAGLYEEVLEDVYWTRVLRQQEHFSWKKIGAFSYDLAAISGFFVTPWLEVQSALTEDDQAFLLNSAAFHLRALGRLREAIEPMGAGLAMYVKQEDWKHATISASNLSELRMTLGGVAQAVADGEASVRHADASGQASQKVISRSSFADALHQAGRLEEAEAVFREVETIQVEAQPQYPKLYGLRAYRFCDLLLGKGEWVSVLERAEQTLEWVTKANWLLEMALDRLSIGRAAHLQAIAQGGKDPRTFRLSTAKTNIDQAVDGLRKSGQTIMLPRGLLARAALHRTLQDYESALSDLAEAYDIAESGEMRLHLTDYRLESARLNIAMGEREAAKGHFEKAKKLIEETGYHRRDGELEELRVALETPSTETEDSAVIPVINSETTAQPPKPPQKPQSSPKSGSTHSPQTLRVLILAANPRDLQHLQTMQEAMDILKLLKQGRFVGKIEPLIPVLNLGVEGLIEELSVRPEVVHFSGHGDQDGIYLVDDSGESELVELPTLKLLFSQLGGFTRLVLLNACYSAMQAREVSKFGIYVAGYNRRIRDKAAIAFSRGLYIGLSAGKSVVDSLRDGLALLLHKDATGGEALEVWKDGERVEL